MIKRKNKNNMKNIFNNKKTYWIWLVVFILLPIITVHVSNEEIARIISTGLVLIGLPLFLLFISIFASSGQFLSNPDSSSKNRHTVVNGLRVVVCLLSVYFLFSSSFPLSKEIYSYFIYKNTTVTTKTVQDLQSGTLDPFRVINTRVQVGQFADDSYSYWYPTLKLEIGNTYNFKLLPNTDIIISAEEN